MAEVSRARTGQGERIAEELTGIYSSGAIDADGLDRALDSEDFVLLVARINDRAVGYLHAALLDRADGGRMLLIYDLEIDDAHRRQGIATALMNEARNHAKQVGAKETWLVTEDDNPEAKALYDSLGGTPFPALGYEWNEEGST